ncbi:hypothetical protein WMF04_15400 [Sorangium sp. So ce260]|uniref:hypothetical protein n=1 Tax=Sorangium sp. So ce260 TaxID=3133291 RepID=UPI003F60B265
MILHRIKAAGLLLAGAAVAALGGFAGIEVAAAAEEGPVVLATPPDEVQPPTTPCGACYNMQNRLLYVSVDKFDMTPVVFLDLYEADGSGAGTYEWLKPFRTEKAYVVYAVPQGPTEGVGSGVVRWRSPYGYVRSRDVTVDGAEPQCDE